MISFSAYLNEIKMPKERHDVRKRSFKERKRIGSRRVSKLNIDKYMKRYGLDLLGKGMYARVYGHPSKNYVVKIFANDPDTLRWFKWVADNKSNKYVPQLRGAPVKIGEKLWSVRMERLYPITHEQFDVFHDYLNDVMSGKIQDQQLHDLGKFIYGPRQKVDLHAGNVMKRSNGHLVVTDPIASIEIFSMYWKLI